MDIKYILGIWSRTAINHCLTDGKSIHCLILNFFSIRNRTIVNITNDGSVWSKTWSKSECSQINAVSERFNESLLGIWNNPYEELLETTSWMRPWRLTINCPSLRKLGIANYHSGREEGKLMQLIWGSFTSNDTNEFPILFLFSEMGQTD
jgi:hypothetical protein